MPVAENHRRNIVHIDSSMRRRFGCFAIGSAMVVLLSGCSVQEHKSGPTENVRIHTPLGGLDVRTDAINGPDVGLPVYPGATERGKQGDQSGSADIRMNFGKWHLNVKAVEYHSNDPEEKVVSFYKKAMERYGDVLICKDKAAIGEPAKTSQGLTCANDHEYDMNVKMDRSSKPVNVETPHLAGGVKLLAGSPEDQHIVEFSPGSNGTKFSMVVIQRPHKKETD